MQLAPKLSVVRFAKIQPGDLFIYAGRQLKCLAFRGVFKEHGGDEIVVLLGPGLPPEDRLRVITPRPETVIAIGKEFTIRLPILPADWSVDAPAPETPCLTVADDRVFFRGNFEDVGLGFKPCWIDASTGVLQYQPLAGITAYALRWEIVLKDALLEKDAVIGLP